VGMSCTHDEGEEAGLAMAIAGSNPIDACHSIARPRRVCGCGVHCCGVCRNSAIARVSAATLASSPSSPRGRRRLKLPGWVVREDIAAWEKQSKQLRSSEGREGEGSRECARVCLAWRLVGLTTKGTNSGKC